MFLAFLGLALGPRTQAQEFSRFLHVCTRAPIDALPSRGAILGSLIWLLCPLPMFDFKCV